MIQDNEMKDNLLSLLEISLGKKIMEYMNDKDIIEIMKMMMVKSLEIVLLKENSIYVIWIVLQLKILLNLLLIM